MKFISASLVITTALCTIGCGDDRELQRPDDPQTTSVTKTVHSGNTVVADDAALEAGGIKQGTTSKTTTSVTTVDGKEVDREVKHESSSKK